MAATCISAAIAAIGAPPHTMGNIPWGQAHAAHGAHSALLGGVRFRCANRAEADAPARPHHLVHLLGGRFPGPL